MRRLLTTEEFIEKAIAVHGNRYDYSDTRYTRSSEKVSVICRLHGSFSVTAGNHLHAKVICPACNTHGRTDLAEFIAEAKEVHGNTYSYDKTVYTNSVTKLTITCREHGDFTMKPDNHKRRGQGCPSCRRAGYCPGRPGYFYVLSDDTVTKVGITNRTPAQRLKEIKRSSGKRLTERFHVYLEDGKRIQEIETVILRYLRKNYPQVKATFDGSTECFVGVDVDQLLTEISNQLSTK